MSSETAADMVIEKTTRGRTALNFWIDLVTGVAFCILIGTSTLMKFILPPGTCDGAGVKSWLGHMRHWWGEIHFWVAVLMLVLMVVHIWLHWGWVVRTWRRVIGSGRAVQTWGVLALMLAFVAVPFIIPAHYEAVSATTETALNSGQAAPCGIAGLSCADCPAADDHLFGGSCASADETAAVADGEAIPAAEAACGGEDCATCPFSTGCAAEDDAAAAAATDPAAEPEPAEGATT